MDIYRSELREATKFWIDKASEIYGKNYDMPVVKTHLKGRRAGHADCKGWEVAFNSYLYIENKQDFLEKTVPHEVAHLIAFKNYFDKYLEYCKPHGIEWKNVMRAFGIKEIKRCHNYDTSEVERKHKRKLTEYPYVYVYVCNCREHHLSAIKHKRALQGQRRICKLCKTILKFDRIDLTFEKECDKVLV